MPVNFLTQCVNYEGMDKDIDWNKMHNVMLKVAMKFGLCHVQLETPHALLSKNTMVMGADVTHDVFGISVSAVVASKDCHFQMYDAEIRAQVLDLKELASYPTNTKVERGMVTKKIL